MVVFNLEPYEFSHVAKELLASHFEYRELQNGADEFLETAYADVEVIITRLQRKMDSSFLSRFLNCRFLICAATGHDHLDLDYLKTHNIELITLRGETRFLRTIPSTAEHTMALMLSLLRNIPAAVNDVVAGNWRRDLFRGYQLYRKRIGLVGLGRIGALMAGYCKAFGMEVSYYDPDVDDHNYKRCATLDELLQSVDIVSLHIHLADDTVNLIDEEQLSKMKKGAYLINTSRGKIVNEAALAESLHTGHLAGAAADVLATELESISQSPLLKAMQKGLNVIITPHIGGATFDAMHMCEEFVVKKLLEKCKIDIE